VKISLSTTELVRQLQTASRVASTRSAIQALAGVCIKATDDAVEMLATDMEVGLRLRLEAEVQRSGTVVLPARLMLDVARALAGPTVTLELRDTEHDVELVSGPTTFHLRTLRADDFPPLPEAGGGEEAGVSVPAQAFVETVAKVARSASRDETRPILTGILVSASGSSLRMVATDSYRLSVKETVLETPLTQPFEANVPARALQELARIAAAVQAETLTVTPRHNQIVFELDGVVLSSRLIDGQFPNYRQLLPETSEHELRVAREELTDVVRRISLLAQKNAPVRLAFTPGELTVSARTPDVGEASEALPIPFQGEPFDIGFNPEFLRDGLESVESDDLILKLTSPLRPGLIESADGSGFVYLVMPIRLNV
jgi:DNA polymerase-3 subunit beta